MPGEASPVTLDRQQIAAEFELKPRAGERTMIGEEYGWQGSLRLADEDDQPVKGIRVTLSP